MLNIKTLRCSKCNSVLFNMPETEIVKLNGSNFFCECCGQMNILEGLHFSKAHHDLSHINYQNLESVQR